MYQLTLTLDSGAKTPMYEQLYRYFVEEIRTGKLKSGEKIPSKRSLCSHLGISGSTVETAYSILVSEGYVNARPRSGYFVADFIAQEGNRPAAAPPEASEHGEPRRPVEFDFSTASVDTSLFPYSSWAKLHKEIVYSSPELLQRGERQGDVSLRAALCAFLSEYRGVNCAPEQIVIGAGMEYLAGLLMQLFPGDAVYGVEDPGYVSMYQTIRAFGGEVRFLPLDPEGVSVSALEQSGVSVLYVTPSHQFPLGITMPASRRSRLLRWASDGRERWIVEDDYDSEFRYGSRPLRAMQGMDTLGRVVYAGTFSRSIAPAVRLAYLVLPQRLLERYRALSGYRYSTVSRYEQAVMARFLSQGYYARYLRRVGSLYRKRREKLIGAMEQIPGAIISGSGGGIHFLLTNDRHTEEELRSRALAAGIELRGLSAYCHRCAPAPSTLVMGYGGLNDAIIPDAVERLRKAWE